LASGAAWEQPVFLLVPIVMGVFGYWLMKQLIWDLVDEVLDGGDYLLVRNRGREDRIHLSNIMNVGASTFTNPPRVTLKLVQPSKFGDEVTFSPVTRVHFNPFAKNPVVEELILRVHRARSAPPRTQ
jgi:hypothetical protein